MCRTSQRVMDSQTLLIFVGFVHAISRSLKMGTNEIVFSHVHSTFFGLVVERLKRNLINSLCTAMLVLSNYAIFGNEIAL